MVAGPGPAANILDILVLMYRIFETNEKLREKTEQPYWWIIKRVFDIWIGYIQIINYPDIRWHP